MELALLGAEYWRLLRDVRLRALKDSPAAYISEYQVESTWGEAEWRARFRYRHWVVVRRGGAIIGLASSVRVDDRPPLERHIESVWVDPRYRRTGVLRAMLAYLGAVEPDVTDWRIWVLDTNEIARKVYDRLGFTPTGEQQPLEDGSGRFEIRLGIHVGR
ncbi:GNAT family N-acetyltransferase [Kribbella sp. NPDC026611]|uniref:GNAT family N-acetyltransferase n=1 Tax=Kribbella sp. NPDC026611 TaxID=3154911 RepID=UPI0033FB2889